MFQQNRAHYDYAKGGRYQYMKRISTKKRTKNETKYHNALVVRKWMDKMIQKSLGLRHRRNCNMIKVTFPDILGDKSIMFPLLQIAAINLFDDSLFTEFALRRCHRDRSVFHLIFQRTLWIRSFNGFIFRIAPALRFPMSRCGHFESARRGEEDKSNTVHQIERASKHFSKI